MPVRTKIPVPMMIPNPMRVMSNAPKAFVNFFSSVVSIKSSKDLRRKMFMLFSPLHYKFSVMNKTAPKN